MLMSVLNVVHYNNSLVHRHISLFFLLHRDMGYDGLVLESWSRWAADGVLYDASLRKMVI